MARTVSDYSFGSFWRRKGAQDQRPTAYGRGCTQKGKKPRIGTAAAHPPDSEDAIERPAHKEGEAKKGA